MATGDSVVSGTGTQNAEDRALAVLLAIAEDGGRQDGSRISAASAILNRPQLFGPVTIVDPEKLETERPRRKTEPDDGA